MTADFNAAAPQLPWPVAALQQQLSGRLPGVVVQAVAATGSTNTDLLQQLRHEAAAVPRLLVAEHQTRGRGRNGRVWLAQPGVSLTFSLGLALQPRQWGGLSLAVGVALAEALEPGAQALRLQIKWPNDLWLADAPQRWRKLGGILIETVAAGAGRACVVGVGLNVQPRDDVQASGMGSGYACVQELEPGLDAPALLLRVAPALAAALRVFEQEGLAPFAAGFARRDALDGLAVRADGAPVPGGVAAGIDADGALRLRVPGDAGPVHLLHGGEVSVRPALREAP